MDAELCDTVVMKEAERLNVLSFGVATQGNQPLALTLP
jgi:hypothetical protein